MHAMDTGTERPLNVSKQSNRRVFVGLSWDPTEDKSFVARLKSVLTGRQSNHDLDLSCFLYDKDQNFINMISGKIGQIVDASGAIYHSGDDKEGAQEGDDEQISAELLNVPEDVHHMIFKVSIDSGHSFDEIEAPAIRLVDGYSDRRFLQADLSADDAAGHNAYIFAELYRKPHADGNWILHFIGQYKSWGDATRWKNKLGQFLTVS